MNLFGIAKCHNNFNLIFAVPSARLGADIVFLYSILFPGSHLNTYMKLKCIARVAINDSNLT